MKSYAFGTAGRIHPLWSCPDLTACSRSLRLHFTWGGSSCPNRNESGDHDDTQYIWMGSLITGEIVRRSPKNVSIEMGYYDGQGGFDGADVSIEKHLSRIESEAAVAIAKFVATPCKTGIEIAPAVSRFLAWQAARTPGWLELVEDWVYHSNPDDDRQVVEPPPQGIERIRDRSRPKLVENPDTGERLLINSPEQFDAHRRRGWKWILDAQDRLEMLHIQAWYFQVRHFPRLSWVRLDAPEGDWFVASDRGVSWAARNFADTPPAALRDPSAIVVAPLTRKVALIGRHGTEPLHATARQVNQIVAALATKWIAGPSQATVAQAIEDRVRAIL